MSETLKISISEKKWAEISPYFKPEELLSPDANGLVTLLDYSLVRFANDFRDLIGPYCVNFGGHVLRGYRSPREHEELRTRNTNAGLCSMHCAGKAIDVSSAHRTPAEIAELAKNFGWAAIGIAENFVHLDRRDLFGGKQVIWRY